MNLDVADDVASRVLWSASTPWNDAIHPHRHQVQQALVVAVVLPLLGGCDRKRERNGHTSSTVAS